MVYCCAYLSQTNNERRSIGLIFLSWVYIYVIKQVIIKASHVYIIKPCSNNVIKVVSFLHITQLFMHYTPTYIYTTQRYRNSPFYYLCASFRIQQLAPMVYTDDMQPHSYPTRKNTEQYQMTIEWLESISSDVGVISFKAYQHFEQDIIMVLDNSLIISSSKQWSGWSMT